MDTTVKAKKPFSWSYSRLKGYETCPRQFYECDILKKWGEGKSELQSFGEAVHAAMAESLRSGKSLPLAHRQYQRWIDQIRKAPGEMLVESECKWGMNRQFQPTGFFANDVWLRTVCDVVKVDLNFPAMAYVVDWKTGKSINVDPMQLTLMALMTFAQFPELLRVRADFVWLPENSKTTQVIGKDEVPDLWAEFIPRVERFKKGMEDENYPPLPNRLCARYCKVETCEYHGR
jgi:hypothetical protein